MTNQWASPVIIGGLNGSGTRVVADVLLRVHYYLGQDFNEAYDNLWFTLLFKRPGWYKSVGNVPSLKVQGSFHVLTKIMFGDKTLSIADWRTILHAALTYSTEQQSDKSIWALRRLFRIIRRSAINLHDYRGWGWKEPHSHLYLPHLVSYYPDMKYIHVIRHGLDMAFSGNQEQVYKWGDVFEIKKPADTKEEIKASLSYWLRANRRAINIGQSLLSNRFLMVNFDKLCSDPSDEVERLLHFLDIDEMDYDTLSKLIVTPHSTGRYLNHDLSVFTLSEIDAVREFGFGID